ncbi:MAG TPA: FIST C-terminal domain-containing protein, partial [Desulfuromonadales bacterium]|nr:FIST C-terminal domain-containing protein [Desulfuromonadales bacterium]
WRREWSKTSLNLCLGFPTPDAIRDGYEEHVIRYMVAKDDQSGSVTIQSEARDGAELWIVRRDKELIREGLQTISRSIRDAVGEKKIKFILQFECVGRGKVVFREQEKVALVRALQEEIGSDIPWLGFYSYGEIGPVKELNCFHNFTSIVLAVY